MKNATQNPSTSAKALKVFGSIILITGIGYLVYNLLKRRPNSLKAVATDLGQTVKSAPQELKAVVTGKYSACGFPLGKGCGGEEVKKVQAFLNKEGNYGLVVDGKFGDLTENAVIENQRPFETFKSMHPTAIKGKISQEFYDSFIK